MARAGCVQGWLCTGLAVARAGQGCGKGRTVRRVGCGKGGLCTGLGCGKGWAGHRVNCIQAVARAGDGSSQSSMVRYRSQLREKTSRKRDILQKQSWGKDRNQEGREKCLLCLLGLNGRLQQANEGDRGRVGSS